MLVFTEDKTRFINKLPYTDEEKQTVIEFFKTHPNLESNIKNWQGKPEDIMAQIDELIVSTNRNKAAKNTDEEKARKAAYAGNINWSSHNCKDLGTYGDWTFVMPLDTVATEFMDSAECGGGGAKWCIGDRNAKDQHYNNYVYKERSSFVMAFNNKVASSKDKYGKTRYMKYMLEITNGYPEFGVINFWNQPDDATTYIEMPGFWAKVDTDNYEVDDDIVEDETACNEIKEILEAHKNLIDEPLKYHNNLRGTVATKRIDLVREVYDEVKGLLPAEFIKANENESNFAEKIVTAWIVANLDEGVNLHEKFETYMVEQGLISNETLNGLRVVVGTDYPSDYENSIKDYVFTFADDIPGVMTPVVMNILHLLCVRAVASGQANYRSMVDSLFGSRSTRFVKTPVVFFYHNYLDDFDVDEESPWVEIDKELTIKFHSYSTGELCSFDNQGNIPVTSGHVLGQTPWMKRNDVTAAELLKFVITNGNEEQFAEMSNEVKDVSFASFNQAFPEAPEFDTISEAIEWLKDLKKEVTEEEVLRNKGVLKQKVKYW